MTRVLKRETFLWSSSSHSRMYSRIQLSVSEQENKRSILKVLQRKDHSLFSKQHQNFQPNFSRDQTTKILFEIHILLSLQLICRREIQSICYWSSSYFRHILNDFLGGRLKSELEIVL